MKPNLLGVICVGAALARISAARAQMDNIADIAAMSDPAGIEHQKLTFRAHIERDPRDLRRMGFDPDLLPEGAQMFPVHRPDICGQFVIGPENLG